ncbi:MAG: M81 family metallopeptidase [Erysipelotrichaceae bacterium]|nr:M81 family metallopeptidase [Erysipelotrichaceae bacterium]MDY5252359.1 M81 family metallopeptidase [Erysipelotrichaceae bacterium]
MKVLVAHMSAECNEHINHTVGLDEFDIRYGDDCIEAMHIKEVFESHGIQIIPAIYANSHPNGMIQRSAFDFIYNKIIDTIKQHLHEIDGIYFHLHGASGVLDLEEVSGEYVILKKVREIVGKHMPIAWVMDPHGNLTPEFADFVNIARCYRESPHSDAIDTKIKVAQLLVDLLEHRRRMKPIIKKLPIMVGGERSVSAKEPMRTINALLDEAEKDPRVFSCSYHVGYIRHDDDSLGAAITFVPNTAKDRAYCEQQADKIARYAWQHRHEFKFSGNYDEVDNAVKMALQYADKTAVITDSGDNCGAGGAGENTIVLKEMLKHQSSKKILFAAINDAQAHAILATKNIGDTFALSLGSNQNADSETVNLTVSLIAKGRQTFASGFELGDAYTIRVANTHLDIVVVDHIIQYGTMRQFHAANLEFHDYDIIVVKMGYLDTELIPETSYHVMALSDGPTIQRSERIPFKRIARPMWPIDEMDELEYIE